MRLETIFDAGVIGFLSAKLFGEPWQIIAVVVGWAVASAGIRALDKLRADLAKTALKSHESSQMRG